MFILQASTARLSPAVSSRSSPLRAARSPSARSGSPTWTAAAGGSGCHATFRCREACVGRGRVARAGLRSPREAGNVTVVVSSILSHLVVVGLFKSLKNKYNFTCWVELLINQVTYTYVEQLPWLFQNLRRLFSHPFCSISAWAPGVSRLSGDWQLSTLRRKSNLVVVVAVVVVLWWCYGDGGGAVVMVVVVVVGLETY